MITEEQEPLCREEWKQTYRVVQCLKRTDNRETWLLEEIQGCGRRILKKACGQQAERLEAEYEMLKRLSSVPDRTIEYYRSDTFACLLRDYIPGRTLTQVVERKEMLSAAETAVVGVRLCRQVKRLHAQQPPVIHRDIKPDNIILTDTGRVCLIDFETVRYYDPGREADTVCMGTRGYAAPEQFGFGQTDERSDIYAIGKVLLYLSTGGCEAEDLSVLCKREEKYLKQVIRRCCAYEPGKRFSNVDEVIRALERRFPSPEKYHRVLRKLSMLCGAMAAVILILGLQSCYFWQELHQLPNTALTQMENMDTWNPYAFEPLVADILRLYQEGEYAQMAGKCEELAQQLAENQIIEKVNTVSYEELSDEELAELQSRRMGYEYIADRLAKEEGIILKNLGSYEIYAQQLANAIRQCLTYSWTDGDGNECHSVIYDYIANGNSQNMDGCILDLLDCMYQSIR